MTRAYVGLGSNIEPEANIRTAMRLLVERERVVAVSTFYRTAAIPPGGPAFINGVVALDTPRPPLALKRDVLRDVEAQLGRTRTGDKNATRSIVICCSTTITWSATTISCSLHGTCRIGRSLRSRSTRSRPTWCCPGRGGR